jgi:hypothetical protein
MDDKDGWDAYMRTLTCAWVTCSTGKDGKNGLADRCKDNGCNGHPANPQTCPFKAFLPAPADLLKLMDDRKQDSARISA